MLFFKNGFMYYFVTLETMEAVGVTGLVLFKGLLKRVGQVIGGGRIIGES